MAQVELKTVDPDEAGMRVDRWFRAHFPEIAFVHLQKLLRSGQVRVDGGRVKANTRLDPGQSVRVPPLGGPGPAGSSNDSPEGSRSTRPRTAVKASSPAAKADAELRAMVLHEDESVVVLNKPQGLAVQGGSGLTKHLDAMLEAWRDAKGQKPRLVHRLDRETSGVLVIAKTRLAASKLAEAFRKRSTRKVYWALVAGAPRPSQGRISTYLTREDEAERMRVAKHGEDDATHAVSLYSTVDQAGNVVAWLTMRPVTGRTHQLRAHAAHIGHPIVGDPLYFEMKDWQLPGGIQNKLHLHARRILIPHPDGGRLDVTAPLAPHMVQSWNLLGFDANLGDAGTDEEGA